jgi:hypothetical protein
VRLEGGELVGDPEPRTGLEWSIALRISEAVGVNVVGARFRNWRTDAIWIGDASAGVVIADVSVQGSGRSGISVVHAADITIERCVLTDTRPGANPGAGIEVEPNSGGERVDRLSIIDTEARGNEVGFYLQPGHGTPGSDYRVIGCRLYDNRKFGLIVNSVSRAVIIDNSILNSPIGASIGSATADRRAARVTVEGNRIDCPRPLILAGVRDSRLEGNDLCGGRIESVALGIAGDMVIRNEVR